MTASKEDRMMKRRPIASLLSAVLLVMGMAGAAIVAAQTAPAAADRSEAVNGWRVEDVASTFADDSGGQVIRMTREVDGNRLVYEVGIYGDGSGGSGWANARYEADANLGGRSCWKAGSAAAETGPPAARGSRVRVVLARELAAVERNCGSPAGATGPLLDGFEGAFALLSAWHNVRLAEIEAAQEAEMAMNDPMDMNMSTDPDTSMDMNATADMNAMPDVEYELEAAADALEAAANAAEAADDPK